MGDAVDLFAESMGVTRSRVRQVLAAHPETAERLALLESQADASRQVAEVQALAALTDDDLSDLAVEDDSRAALAESVDRRARNKLRAQIAAHESWANTSDPTARTEPARRAYRESFADRIDPDHRLPPAERARRGEHAYKAHMKRLALKSAQVRRASATGRNPKAK